MSSSAQRLWISGVMGVGLTCLVAGGCGSDQTILTPVDASQVGAAPAASQASAKAPAPSSAKFKGIGNKGNPE